MKFEEIPPSERSPGLTRLYAGARCIVCVGTGGVVRAACIEKYEYPERFIDDRGDDRYAPGDMVQF
jgi:hypothetical protein